MQQPKMKYSEADWNAVHHIGGWGVEGIEEDAQGHGLMRVALNWDGGRGKWGKHPKKHWTSKKGLESGAEMLLREPLRWNEFNNWRRNGRGVMGIIPYHFGIAVIDIDPPAGETREEKLDAARKMADRFVAKHGQPIETIETGSGGIHLLYPIKPSEDGQAHKDWPMRSFLFEGEEFGEVPCGARFSTLWSPEQWWEAIQKRRAMGEDDRYLSSGEIDWVPEKKGRTSQPKIKASQVAGGVHTAMTQRNATREGRILEGLVEAYSLKAHPTEPNTFIGDCPGCGGNTATRFKAYLWQGRTMVWCWKCLGETYDWREVMKPGWDLGGYLPGEPGEGKDIDTGEETGPSLAKWMKSIDALPIPLAEDFRVGGKYYDADLVEDYRKRMGLDRNDDDGQQEAEEEEYQSRDEMLGAIDAQKAHIQVMQSDYESVVSAAYEIEEEVCRLDGDIKEATAAQNAFKLEDKDAAIKGEKTSNGPKIRALGSVLKATKDALKEATDNYDKACDEIRVAARAVFDAKEGLSAMVRKLVEKDAEDGVETDSEITDMLSGIADDADDDSHIEMTLDPYREILTKPFRDAGRLSGWHVCEEGADGIADLWWKMALDANKSEPSAQDAFPKAFLREVEERCGQISKYFDMGDEEAVYSIKCILTCARYVGVGVANCTRLLNDAPKVRGKGRVQFPDKTIPNALSKVANEGFESPFAAQRLILRFGGFTPPRPMDRKAGDLTYLLRKFGFDVIFSHLDGCYFVTHKDIAGWEKCTEFTRVRAPEYAHLERVRAAVVDNCLSIATAGPSDPRSNFMWEGTYVIGSGIPDAWSSAKGIYNLFNSLRRREIPEVDFISDWTRSIVVKHAQMKESDPDALGRCVWLAENFLTHPDLPIRPADGWETLAHYAGRVVYPTFMKRRLEGLHGVDGPAAVTPQRYVPVLYGRKGTSKSSMAKLIIPSSEHLVVADGEGVGDAERLPKDLFDALMAEYEVFDGRIKPNFAFSSDGNECLRQLSGQVVVVNDELSGMAGADVSVTKEIITINKASYHEKYEPYKDMRRTDVLICTTNDNARIPNDEPLRDRLVMTKVVKRDGTESDYRTFLRTQAFLSRNYEWLMIGGLEIAYRMERGEYSMEPPAEIAHLRARAFDEVNRDPKDISGKVLDLISQGVYSFQDKRGVKWLTVNRVAQHLSQLRYQEDVNVRLDGDLDDDVPMRYSQEEILFRGRGKKSNESIEITDTLEIGFGSNSYTLMPGNEFSIWAVSAYNKVDPAITTQIKNTLTSLTGAEMERKTPPVEYARAWLGGSLWSKGVERAKQNPKVYCVRLDGDALARRLAIHAEGGSDAV